MLRRRHTHLTADERMSQINAIVVSGGLLLYSDDFTRLPGEMFDEIRTIAGHNAACFRGEPIALDLMEREIPELFYNTAGYVGIFNATERPQTKSVDLSALPGRNASSGRTRGGLRLTDVWSGDTLEIPSGMPLVLKNMRPHSSRLFRLEGRENRERRKDPKT